MAHKPKPDVSDVITAMAADPIYTLPRAASILDCNERILASKFKAGEIKARKRLGKWYCKHSDLLAFIS